MSRFSYWRCEYQLFNFQLKEKKPSISFTILQRSHNSNLKNKLTDFALKSIRMESFVDEIFLNLANIHEIISKFFNNSYGCWLRLMSAFCCCLQTERNTLYELFLLPLFNVMMWCVRYCLVASVSMRCCVLQDDDCS